MLTALAYNSSAYGVFVGEHAGGQRLDHWRPEMAAATVPLPLTLRECPCGTPCINGNPPRPPQHRLR